MFLCNKGVIMTEEFAGVQVTHNGKTMALSEWAHTLGLPYATVRMRYKRGERDTDRLLATPRFKRSALSPKVPNPTHATLDDLFPAQVVDQLREIARQAGISPIQVVQKIVEKRVKELMTPQQETN
jgi:hypothetical protein